MGTKRFTGSAVKALLMGVVGVVAASACAAQETPSNRILVRVGQSNQWIEVNTTPAPASYALTGEQSQYQQTLRASAKVLGPVLQVGNARIVVPEGQ